jgi:hypothetical protein
MPCGLHAGFAAQFSWPDGTAIYWNIMPRLVALLLFTLLLSAQAASAARLPEMQPAGSSKAGTAVLSNKDNSPRPEAAAAPEETLVADALQAGMQGDPATTAQADADTAEKTEGTPARELAASPALNNSGSSNPAPASDSANPAKTDKDAAAAIISGSRRPGVIEHQIVRTNRGDKPDINLSYPSLGVRAIDANIRNWATGIADAFEETFNSPGLYPDNNRPVPELWCSYAVSHPSDKALSITFEVWTYTGGSQGNLDVMTLNYSLLSGQRLGLVDIFEDPDAALAIMSAWSHKELTQRLGGMRQEQMLRTGLSPVPENFASLTLTPSGIRINFQPYQVAPGMAGAQKVDIPLEELLPAHPLLLLWGK